MPVRTLVTALVLLVALGCGRDAFAAQATADDPRALPLVDQLGKTFRLRDFAGEPTVLTFVASRCTDACPIANAMFLQTYKRLRHDRVAARLLTVTLDPAYDTPAVMARVARHFGVPRSAWRFASGRPVDVAALMESLGVSARPDAHGIPEEHSSFVYVLDGDVRLHKSLMLSTDLTNEVEAAVRSAKV
jgi:protein SCO1/2